MFKTATKKQSKLRLALVGPAGSGKTYTALALGTNLGSRVAVIDTERGSASLYSDMFKFDVCELANHNPENYIKAIKEAESAGYDVLVIDSLSHAWSGIDGALELKDQAAKKSQSKNDWAAWRDVTPLHNRLVDTMLQSRCHIVATLRAKTEYVLEADGKGKNVPRKIGLAPIQRDGVEYEFTVTADMTIDHDMIIGKTRCNVVDGKVFHKPGKDVADILKAWLLAGDVPAVPHETAPAEDLPELPPEGKERAAFDAADATLTLLDLCKMNDIADGFLSTYLKKKFDDKLTEGNFGIALRDIDAVVEEVNALDGKDIDRTEALKNAFRKVVAK